MEKFVTIRKLDAKKQLAYGPVYVPGVIDSQGDFMTAEQIERSAHDFLRRGLVKQIDVEHDLLPGGVAVVESFLTREGDSDYPIPGTWVLGVHVSDRDKWAKVESGEINGFSMYGTGRREERVLEIEIPDDGIVKGETSYHASHSHEFRVQFSTDGKFMGGDTSAAGGHSHRITQGTATAEGPDGHTHRFSLVDSLFKP